MSVKSWTCLTRVLQIIVFRAEQVHSSACTSRCDELGVGQNRVAARYRQVREASSSSFGVGPSGLSLCDECWSLARRFGEWDEPTPCGPCAAVFARVHFRRLLEGFRRSLPVFGCRPSRGAFRGGPEGLGRGVRVGVRSDQEIVRGMHASSLMGRETGRRAGVL